MRGSLGLAAYRALMRRGAVPQFSASADRPAGEIVWLHAGDPSQARAVIDLAARLVHARPEMSALITAADDSLEKLSANTPPHPDIHLQIAPTEHPEHISQFLNHWQPNMLIWVWGGLRPNLIIDAQKRGMPLVLIDAGKDGFESRRDRWLPEVPRQVVAAFDSVLARSQAAHKRLAQLGRPLSSIELTAPLLPTGQALPVNDAEMDELCEIVHGRPVWLAVDMHHDELDAVLKAHRQASRLSHRLMLIAHCHGPDEAEKLKALCEAESMRVADWNNGDMPDDNIQVLIDDVPDALGLWYRLSPVAFLGQSLISQGTGTDPYAAASLGTAILYGPHVGNHLGAYSRLAHAGAARIVRDSETLGAAVGRLIAPDLAASMAMAGWDTITEGAAVADRVTELVNDALDERLAVAE